MKLQIQDKEWVDIPKYKGYYQATSSGYIRSVDHVLTSKAGWSRPVRGKILKPQDNGHGYLFFRFGRVGIPEYIHRVIAKTFIPNPHNLPEVNHKDFDKSNNSVGNLEWCTRKYNNDHLLANKKINRPDFKGSKNPRCRLSENDILAIRELRGKCTVKEIAKKYKITIYHVYNIFKINNWKHLKSA